MIILSERIKTAVQTYVSRKVCTICTCSFNNLFLNREYTIVTYAGKNLFDDYSSVKFQKVSRIHEELRIMYSEISTSWQTRRLKPVCPFNFFCCSCLIVIWILRLIVNTHVCSTALKSLEWSKLIIFKIFFLNANATT